MQPRLAPINATDPVLLRPVDLMGALQFSRSRVYQLLASGEIPSIAIGRLRRVRRQDFDDWIAAQ